MERFKTVLFMVLVAAVFGSGVTGLHLASKSAIEDNNKFIEQKALVKLFGLSDKELSKSEVIDLVAKRVTQKKKDEEPKKGDICTDPVTGREFVIIRAYKDDAKKELKAYGFEFKGVGFWSEIVGKLAVSPDLKQSLGIVITKQAETPGLGGRVEEEQFGEAFFNKLTVSLPKDGVKPLYLSVGGAAKSEKGAPKYGREFDAITGATQTSLAMERILNEYIASFMRAMKNRQGGQDVL